MAYPVTINRLGVLVVAVVIATITPAAQQSQHPPAAGAPVVLNGRIPTFPQIARMAKVQGEVQLRVTTDGQRVVGVAEIKGNRLLSQSAVEHVQLWQFAPHAPTSFTTTIRFEPNTATACPGSDRAASVTMRLPFELLVQSVSNERPAFCGPSDDQKVRRLSAVAGTLTCHCRSKAPVRDARLMIWAVDSPTRIARRLRSDADGRFSVEALPPGGYFLDVHEPGYRLVRIPIAIDPTASAAPLAIALWPEPHPDPLTPVVLEADAPQYPARVRRRGIEGDVRLQRQPDGDLFLIEGNEQLGDLAIANIRSWRFDGYSPNLEILFRFRLLPADCTANQNPSIDMRLPIEVTITARRIVPCSSAKKPGDPRVLQDVKGVEEVKVR